MYYSMSRTTEVIIFFLASQYYVYRNARQKESCTSEKRWFDIKGVDATYIYVSQTQEVPKLESYKFLYKI